MNEQTKLFDILRGNGGEVSREADVFDARVRTHTAHCLTKLTGLSAACVKRKFGAVIVL